jgi:hypothetical protein
MQRVVYRPWFEWRDLRPASLLLHLCLRPDYGPLTGTEVTSRSPRRPLATNQVPGTSAGGALEARKHLRGDPPHREEVDDDVREVGDDFETLAAPEKRRDLAAER